MTVRLIDYDGSQIGIVGINEALQKAKDEEMDLIEIAPFAQPPVCKIFPFDKYKYEQQQKIKEARKKQKDVEIKEFRFRPNIFKGDLEVKVERINEFLEKGSHIKINIQFQGREIAHKELGHELLERVKKMITQPFIFDKEPKFEGRNLVTILAPEKRKDNAKTEN